MSRASERKQAQRHAHVAGLDNRNQGGDGVSADDLRNARSAERHHPPRPKPKIRPRWRDQAGIGAAVMERMVSEARRKQDKPPKPNLIAVPCTCNPPRAHGPHWVLPTEDEQAALKEAA